MPWLSEAKKDVISCDKQRGAAHWLGSVDFRMGQPVTLKVYHAKAGERGELKHLSTRRKREQIVISQVVASEREEAQTGFVTAKSGL